MDNLEQSWHFNFRDKRKLPDISELKRKFHLSVAFCLLALGLFGCFICAQLYSLGLGLRVAHLKTQIEEQTPGNNKILEQNKNFEAYASFFKDLKSVYSPLIEPIECMQNISKALPAGFIFKNIGFKEAEGLQEGKIIRTYTIDLEGFIQEIESKALNLVSQFKEQFEQIEYFKPMMADLKIESLKRDSEDANMLRFHIQLKLHTS